MEFKNQYLTYAEYVELGGNLQEMPFNILELSARKNIDERTLNRLKNAIEIPLEVKVCVYNLIKLLNGYETLEDGNISSESTDGYSVTYKQVDKKSREQEIINSIENDLYGVIVNNIPILYLGVC